MPRLARTGSSTPSSMKVCWPMAGAVQGVAGASTASTWANKASTCSRYQRRNFCALTTCAAGIMAPAIRRSRTAGSKSRPRAQASEVKRAAFAGGDDIGRGARAFRFRKLDLVRRAERGGDAGERGLRLRRRAGAKVAAGDGDAQARAAALEQRRDRLDRAPRAHRIIVVVALHRVIGEREIARAARQWPDVIEACHEGKRVGARKPAIGRLQAENPA